MVVTFAKRPRRLRDDFEMFHKSSCNTALTSILLPALSCLPFSEDIHGEGKVCKSAAGEQPRTA
jgi:hypothetical protein